MQYTYHLGIKTGCTRFEDVPFLKRKKKIKLKYIVRPQCAFFNLRGCSGVFCATMELSQLKFNVIEKNFTGCKRRKISNRFRFEVLQPELRRQNRGAGDSEPPLSYEMY